MVIIVYASLLFFSPVSEPQPEQITGSETPRAFDSTAVTVKTGL